MRAAGGDRGIDAFTTLPESYAKAAQWHRDVAKGFDAMATRLLIVLDRIVNRTMREGDLKPLDVGKFYEGPAGRRGPSKACACLYASSRFH